MISLISINCNVTRVSFRNCLCISGKIFVRGNFLKKKKKQPQKNFIKEEQWSKVDKFTGKKKTPQKTLQAVSRSRLFNPGLRMCFLKHILTGLCANRISVPEKIIDRFQPLVLINNNENIFICH